MRGWLRLICVCLVYASVPAQSPCLQIWCRDASGVMAKGASSDAPLAVGSLQKPFVAQAWAATHPDGPSPRFHCDPGSGCWLPAGHGELGLERALALSCNTYFRHLAEATPLVNLDASLRAAGFTRAPDSADESIGLPGADGPLRVRPSALLAAYARLARVPWPSGESIRSEILAGLREAGLDGTAKALGQRGYWAKTGTAPASDGNPLHTCGLALAVDDSGWAILARLEPGTGREAAAAMAETLARLRPWALRHATASRTRGPVPVATLETREIRVRMFDLVPSPGWEARNLGLAPIPAGTGYLGSGGAQALHVGDTLGPGLIELRSAGSGARRQFNGRLLVQAGRGGTLRLIGILNLRDYVSGVVMAELPDGSANLKEKLGAAVIRFLAQGPRHADADVCDKTHCAWFVGRGPRLDWTDARHAAVLPGASDAGFGDGAWTRILDAAREPGPHQWTAHCGGEPLSPNAVWGNGDNTVTPCPRHSAGSSDPWTRTWSAADVEKAFGVPVRTLAIATDRGIWVLRVHTGKGARAYRYDDAHRAIAGILGWNALPSPADKIEPVEGGFRVEGRGSGHRAGLCLAE
ncbi:MAG TPA: hypothetical protein VFF76_06530 [Holophagaceae bacterium]|jgi:hypothetical protein|nr:hypothetical protein [Holophagaceae bacterium]